ncbi:conserved hypothetical protein [Vibrio nigripulchritudo MADA3029]|uniref:hypothetical protein n=1 Tax=Vibrio nigripulchritudo TaxID=28173 RepID=UPI0003B1DCA6|nr:hypothetical protein [Vibrio nigripulchritudo]CCN48801.1 conserved hypothetical protein [Vibrio nigripulchritudo MADA3020]CCN54060.1 conserved hypothetical protein [Vibrio nigripulchritudo MADA3021]CCN60922.1 conserved hypothetical protein [Vibrio nigripulchritudo MADA3029]
MTTYNAKVLGLNRDIEEEVTLEVNGVVLTCFAGVCPYELTIGQEYLVTFEMLDFDLSEQKNSEETSLKRIGNTYAYELKGKLSGSTINTVVEVSDEFLQSNYGYLDGNYICLIVERLDVEFLN